MTTTATAPEIDLDAPIWQDCWKCGGTGFIPSYSFIYDGVCFACNGTRGKNTTQRKLNANAKARERYAAKKEAKRLERLAAKEAEAAEQAAQVEVTKAAYAAEHPEVVQALEVLTGSFGESLRETFETSGALTARQAEVALRIAADKANEPEAAAVVEGRGEITGKVVTTKWVDNNYGGSLKMLVLDDRGFKVWGSVPQGLDGVDNGSRVTLTATVKASGDDEAFGWFSRPTKAALVG